MRAHPAIRVAGCTRPGRGARDPRDEGTSGGASPSAEGSPNVSSSVGAAASATSSSRCSCCSSCTAAHDPTVRSPTTLDALHELAGGGYIERDDADHLDDAYRYLRTVEHRLQLYDEQQTHTIPVRPAVSAPARARARVPRQSHAQLARGVRSRPPCPPVHGAHDPRALVLRAVAGDPRRRRPALSRGRGGAARRIRVHRRGTHTRRGTRARLRADPALQAHATAAPRHPRVALDIARSRPRSAPAATDWRKAPLVRRRSPPPSGTRRARRSGRAGSSGRAEWSGDALRRHPEFVDDARRRRRARPGEATARSSSPTRSRRWSGVATTRSPTRGSPPVQAARVAARRRAAISSASHHSKSPNGSSPGSPRRASRRRCRGSTRRCRSR